VLCIIDKGQHHTRAQTIYSPALCYEPALATEFLSNLSLKSKIIPGDVGTDDSDSDDEEETDYVQALHLKGGGRNGMI
jgi:hypothetical protein